MQQKIVLIGGPGSGKTTVINELQKRGYSCMPEISRAITIEAQKQGIDQLFLESPVLFSEKLLEGRIHQFHEAEELSSKIVFFDRGIPDIPAYLDYSGTIDRPEVFNKKSESYRYDKVLFLPPWEEIYEDDNERYETFEQSVEISKFLIEMYEKLNYQIIEVPFGKVELRCDFIEKNIISKTNEVI